VSQPDQEKHEHPSDVDRNNASPARLSPEELEGEAEAEKEGKGRVKVAGNENIEQLADRIVHGSASRGFRAGKVDQQDSKQRKSPEDVNGGIAFA
jgi:hypothetical protein